MKVDRRYSDRKPIRGVSFSELTSLDNYDLIAHIGEIVDASSSGFLVHVHRNDLAAKDLKSGLSLESLLGKQVALFLPQMNLDLDGIVSRAKHLGRGVFELAIQFSMDVPEYWRECLVDLLPDPGEFDEESL